MPCNVQIDHPDLQDGAIQVPGRAGFIPSGRLERLMGFEIMPGVEQRNPLNGFCVEWSDTVGRYRCTQIGHGEENYNIALARRIWVLLPAPVRRYGYERMVYVSQAISSNAWGLPQHLLGFALKY
jgi:hypothetical protein